MASIGIPRILASTMFLLLVPLSGAAQVASGPSLQGDWVRTDSNYDPNDTMRITIKGNQATLISVPTTVVRGFSVGQILWKAIQSDGTLQVLGNDGSYYPARLTFQGVDVVQIDIHHSGAGNDQTWSRAGPSIAGDWVRIAAPGAPNDGIQVRVAGSQAAVRYLPATAPRRLRVGSHLWQSIGAGTTLQVMGSDGRYHPAQYTLLGADSLRIDSSSPQVTGGQIWVRPSIVAAARSVVRPPPPNPNQPGSGLQPMNPPPALPPPPAAPPVPAASPAACVASSQPYVQTGRPWGWGLTVPTRDSPLETSLGVWNDIMADFDHAQARRLGNAPVDIERSRIPGLEDGFGFVWEQNRRIFWDEHRDLTSSELDQQMQTARSSGNLPTDIEAYRTRAGMRYAGLWVRNVQGIDWRVDYGLTAAEYGQAYQTNRSDGYRLVDMEAYQTPGGLRYAAVWHQSCDNANWRQRRDMDRTNYQQWVDDYADQGFRVIDFESYQTSSGQRYAAIWERIPAGTEWAVRTDRTLKWFLNYHRQYVDEGLKLIDYEAYDTSNGIRYAGVWAENDARHDFAFKSVVDTMVQNYRARHRIPGISVVIMDSAEVIYRRGFGWADSLAQKQAHSGTIYLAASVSKAIGGTLAARLEELGHVDLTRQTGSIVDDVPSGHTHTVEQLLAKIGCIRHYNGSFQDPNQSRDQNGNLFLNEKYYRWRAVAIDSIQSPILPNCTPGQRYLYSTHGYTFVGAVLEEVMREDIQQIVAEELQLPYQLPTLMTMGSFPVAGPSGPVPFYDLAQGYRYNQATGVSDPVDYEDSSWKVLGGGLQISAIDLARFGWLTLNGDIVGPLTRDNRLWNPLTGGAVDWTPPGATPATTLADTFALAWLIERRNPGQLVSGTMVPRRVAEHGGTARGARSILRIYRDDGLIIAILTNQRNGALTPNTSHPVESMSGGTTDLATRVATAVFANPPP